MNRVQIFILGPEIYVPVDGDFSTGSARQGRLSAQHRGGRWVGVWKFRCPRHSPGRSRGVICGILFGQLGAVLTFVPPMIVGLVGRKVFKLHYPTLCGAWLEA